MQNCHLLMSLLVGMMIIFYHPIHHHHQQQPISGGPVPTTTTTIIQALSSKKRKHLNHHARLRLHTFSSCSSPPLQLLVSSTSAPCVSMAISRILVGFYLLCISLEHTRFGAEGVEEIRLEHVSNDPLTNGSVTSSTAGTSIDGRSRSELCGTDISFLGPPYGNILASNMICSPVWNNFVLRYYQRSDNLMTIVLSAVYTTGWVGIGFSRNGMMLGSSAMVGWFNRKGEARIKQFYLQGRHTYQVIADKGELPLTNIPPVVALHREMIYLAFQAKFEHRLGRQPIILAFGTRHPKHLHLTRHDDKTAIWFDFSQASVTNIDISQRKNHGTLGLLGWGLFLPAGAIVARYLKHKDPLWYYLHAVIQFLGFILGLAAVLLGLQLYQNMNADIPAHRGIGIFVLVLSILQVLAFFLRPNKDSKYRRYWNWYHHWFGRMALFFGSLNIVLGIQYANARDEWKIGYGFLLAITLLAVIVLETLSCLRRRRDDKSNLPPNYQMNQI